MRLRSIRYKDGRAALHVLHTPMVDECNGEPENWRGKLIEHSKNIACQDGAGSLLDGYLVVGLFSDGMTSVAYRLPERIPQCLAMAYISEIIRRDVVTEREAERVFDDKFEWVE
jgi:hypothetical protein